MSHLKPSFACALSAVLLASASAHSADLAAESDATLREVVVTATRTPQPLDNVLAPVTVITREELARSLSTDTAELLRMYAGVEVARTGGTGQPASVFIRGGESNHTLVLLDGVRMNPGTIGNASLQNIPPESIERIEIVKGPRSTLYGSDAIGGVINIITRKSTPDGIGAEAQVGYGSDDTRRASGLFDIGGEIGSAGLHASWLKSDGFPTRRGSSIDSPYDNLTFGAHANAQAGSMDLRARFYQSSGTADYLSSITIPLSQDYVDRISHLTAATQVNSLWRTQLVLSRLYNEIEQRQPNAFSGGQRDYLETVRHTADWQNDLAIDTNHRLTAGVMYAEETAQALSFGTLLDRDTDIVNAYIQHQYAEESHALLLAAGYTDYSTFGDHLTWNAEYGYSFSTGTKVIAAAGKAFRAPNATDLYGFAGNPNLEPEHSQSYELSLRQRITENQSASVTAFQNDVDDLITFDSVTFTVQNIARARTRGVEARYEIRGAEWRAHLDAVYQDPRNRDTDQPLLRRAKKSASAGYAQQFGILEVATNVLYSGARRDSQFPGFVTLDSYVLANINARVMLGDQWSLIAQIDNVFNTRYEVARGYNTADRGGSLAVRWNMR